MTTTPTALLLCLVGRRRCGKSTVADLLKAKAGFHTLAFADPLKRLTGMIFGVSPTILWGSPDARDRTLVSFANNLAGEYTGRVHFGSGRQQITDIFGDLAIEARNRLTAQINAWHQLQRSTGRAPAVRALLQWIGTEWGQGLHRTVWVEHALREARSLATGFYDYDPETGLNPHTTQILPAGLQVAPVVVTDGRFRHELQGIRDAGGLNWWLDASKRIPFDPNDDHARHSSEPLRSALEDLLDRDLDRNGPAFGGPEADDPEPLFVGLEADFGALYPGVRSYQPQGHYLRNDAVLRALAELKTLPPVNTPPADLIPEES